MICNGWVDVCGRHIKHWDDRLVDIGLKTGISLITVGWIVVDGVWSTQIYCCCGKDVCWMKLLFDVEHIQSCDEVGSVHKSICSCWGKQTHGSDCWKIWIKQKENENIYRFKRDTESKTKKFECKHE